MPPYLDVPPNTDKRTLCYKHGFLFCNNTWISDKSNAYCTVEEQPTTTTAPTASLATTIDTATTKTTAATLTTPTDAAAGRLGPRPPPRTTTLGVPQRLRMDQGGSPSLPDLWSPAPQGSCQHSWKPGRECFRRHRSD